MPPLDKNIWTCEFNCKKTCIVQFHMFSPMFFTPFSQGVKPLRPAGLWTGGIFHRVITYVKPCEKPLNFRSVFHGPGRKSQNLWTGQFSQGQNLWKTLWNGRSLPGRCCQRSPPCHPAPPPQTKNTMLKSDFCPQVTGNLCMHLSCIS